ncbi:ArsR family transcriptional regulator [Flavobacterium sp. NRK1]|uniref:ArsR family transcriptional regulator n=1 Tax=Flavobacterium sp. NRK1 TaxID=2954929 RepID=UPI0020929913|nr:ArsR family transcriptional regulator [Flavobacterium sp. NRK1]MCO6146894.1 ArsR family transcriptional regulator [Flavobacterium sp. NRK1]
MLDSIITSKTRLRLLVKFFINAANEGHLRGLANEFNESTNAIRKELNNLSDAGYLEKENVSNKIRYRANKSHPLFLPLQNIVRKYLGLDTIVEEVLGRMGNVRQIVLIGDYANGIDTGKIEVVVVGDNLDNSYLENLAIKIEKIINREVLFASSNKEIEQGLIVFGRT